jgi:hypothetical protein
MIELTDEMAEAMLKTIKAAEQLAKVTKLTTLKNDLYAMGCTLGSKLAESKAKTEKRKRQVVTTESGRPIGYKYQ